MTEKNITGDHRGMPECLLPPSMRSPKNTQEISMAELKNCPLCNVDVTLEETSTERTIRCETIKGDVLC